MSVGENGYIEACHAIVGAAKTIESAIRDDTTLAVDLKVLGKPLVSVVAFTSDTLEIYDVADAMSEKGWHLNALQSPAAIHVAVTKPMVAKVETLIQDLKEVIEAQREKERLLIAEGKAKAKGKKGDAAALYGVAGSLPNKSIVVELASGFLDTLYKT